MIVFIFGRSEENMPDPTSIAEVKMSTRNKMGSSDYNSSWCIKDLNKLHETPSFDLEFLRSVGIELLLAPTHITEEQILAGFDFEFTINEMKFVLKNAYSSQLVREYHQKPVAAINKF